MLCALSATRDGLTTDEAQKRLAQYGPNVLDKKGGASVMELIWGQINNPLIWVLIGSAVIAMLVDPADGIKNGLVILAVVIINTIIGFAQEYKASKAIESLSAMVPEFATVQRDGRRVQLPVGELVPGDVVFLQGGDKVPADMRLFDLRTLQIEAAALTGESVPVEKMTDPVAENAGLGDRRNMAFSGSLVTYGTGLGVVRRLPSVETLGSTTVICSDKTGTLTRNEMTVQALYLPRSGMYRVEGAGYQPVGRLSRDGSHLTPATNDVHELLLAGILCCDANLEQKEDRWQITGDPTEGALVTAGEKFGIRTAHTRKHHARLDTIPFESANQFMATLHDWGAEGWKIIIKGAPEVVLRRCGNVDQNTVIHQVEALANEGMRVLGFAEKRFDRAGLTMEVCAKGFEFTGLQAMIDPPRAEVIDAIRACHQAGITVKMITGDHRGTAQAIGEQLGIAKHGAKAVTGVQLAEMDEAAMRGIVKDHNVFARVAPEHKLHLVRALQENGQVTAMTGDGVNDAPALKQSNIGVAMGMTGTSASR